MQRKRATKPIGVKAIHVSLSAAGIMLAVQLLHLHTHTHLMKSLGYNIYINLGFCDISFLSSER